jgi:D-glycero-D-manno-heptose 1,7-bisphosphate phosphatase
MSQRAIFLDRDGTLVHSYHYPSRPEHLRLYDNIGPGLCALQGMGFRIVIVTNQAGIARGYFTHAELAIMHDYLTGALAQLGVYVDGIYHCPHHPEGTVPEFAFCCDCRKPQPGMLLKAEADLDIDLGRSWFVGDILDDVEAGNRAGCRTVLVDLGTESMPEQAIRYPTFIARNTLHALEIVNSVETLASTVDLAYCPAKWQSIASSLAWNGRQGVSKECNYV